MSKPPSLETQLRTERAKVRRLAAENTEFRNEVVRLRNTMKLMSDEVKKWQERFDLLLKRDERNK